jgi:hypothetical protein
VAWVSLLATAGAIGLAREHCIAELSGHCCVGLGVSLKTKPKMRGLTEQSLEPGIGHTEIEMLAYES